MEKEEIRQMMSMMKLRMEHTKTDLNTLTTTEIGANTLQRTYIQFIEGAIDFALTNLRNLEEKINE